jgi:hypothetical protein
MTRETVTDIAKVIITEAAKRAIQKWIDNPSYSCMCLLIILVLAFVLICLWGYFFFYITLRCSGLKGIC